MFRGRVANAPRVLPRTDIPVRVLPDDVYDTLHFSALAFGGIGAGKWWVRGTGSPVCYVGHLYVAGVIPSEMELAPFGIDEDQNDTAVAGAGSFVDDAQVEASRIPFEEWCWRLNVIPARAVTERSEVTP